MSSNTSLTSSNDNDPVTKDLCQHKRANVINAREFYAADQTLTIEDREKLAKVFTTQRNSELASKVFIAYMVFLMPRHVSKLLKKPLRPLSAVPAVLACSALMFGSDRFWRQIYNWNYTLNHTPEYQTNTAYGKVIELLKGYPAAIGREYFTETSVNESARFADPNSIDWKKSPEFPLILGTSDWTSIRTYIDFIPSPKRENN
ncbi:uncharacterized protein SAPINGB_P006392 [Magnusiomyces paraingens]|uniref:Uncharacterized protein n=1 Tax=Magnusiomyces paraingens TaxID=2606893 RepID=A0A5E8C4Q4_9ASCO|nr:uncharacterized protein SAPINGB_P006392 [Saprochaete ingens]VVT58804.1 unnamed protein product [Saprochaete ingens]